MPRTAGREHSSDTRKTRDHVWVLAAGWCPLRTPWSRPYVGQYSITSTTSSISLPSVPRTALRYTQLGTRGRNCPE